ncbi:MAG: Gfo/Idh/MocA family oxidoreductase [Thermomicrobiales bacterium]|nr:Gfo/Idh/MocA family oxidoreductase [Thermomicrobiales bacterium]
MADLRVGVIGLGRMGWLHAAQLSGSIRGARLVAAAVDPEHRKRLDADGSAPCPLVDDADALFDDPSLDAIVVVSPTNAHRQHIERAALAGKAVFAEKPLAGSVDDALAVAETVRRSGIPFQIGFQRRFDLGYARARELIAAGAIGEPEMFRGISCDVIPPVDYLRTSGGLFWDLGIHDFDAARFLMGDEIVAVFATGAIVVEPRLAEFDDVDYGIVTLRFRHGGLGVVQNAWRAPYGYDIRGEVHGSRGKIVTELDAREPTALYTDHAFAFRRHNLFVERFEEAYRLELQAFVDAVRRGEMPTPGIDDAVNAVLVSNAATVSRRENRWVDIPS